MNTTPAVQVKPIWIAAYIENHPTAIKALR
jgi:hypothetical protein